MSMPPRTVVVRALAPLLVLAAATGVAHAQGGGGPTIYRCGAGQYSSEPCPGGVKLDTPAPPTPEQQRLAREAAARDAKLAQQLADERRAREREAAAQAASLGPTKAGAASEPKAAPPKKSGKDRKSGKKADAQPKAGKAEKATKTAGKARKAKTRR
jgi:hypothetical protein